MIEVVKSYVRKAEQRYLSVFVLLKFARKYFFRQLVWSKRESYSQLGEDLALLKLQSGCAEKIFLDVGCFHPLRYSNTRLLKKKNWKGIHVDASRESIRLFERVYPDDIAINAILSTSTDLSLDEFYPDQILAMNKLKQKSGLSISDQSPGVLDEQHTDRGLAEQTKKNKPPRAMDIAVISPMALYEKICSSLGTRFRQIGFLNLDIEGLEIDFLENWPFDQCYFELICVENHAGNLDRVLGSDTHRLMSKLGYELIWFFRFSTIYEKHKKNEPF